MAVTGTLRNWRFHSVIGALTTDRRSPPAIDAAAMNRLVSESALIDTRIVSPGDTSSQCPEVSGDDADHHQAGLPGEVHLDEQAAHRVAAEPHQARRTGAHAGVGDGEVELPVAVLDGDPRAVRLARAEVDGVAVADDGEGVGLTAFGQGGDEADAVVDVGAKGVGDCQLEADEVAKPIAAPGARALTSPIAPWAAMPKMASAHTAITAARLMATPVGCSRRAMSTKPMIAPRVSSGMNSLV